MLFSVLFGQFVPPPVNLCQPQVDKTEFLAVGGGIDASNTEIALEKNLRYFQRTLQTLGYSPQRMTYLFADGNSGKAVVRYLDPQGDEQFKPAEIPFLSGRASWANIQAWFRSRANNSHPLFFYFTGHGLRNKSNPDNNSFTVWQEPTVSVRQLAELLDTMPARPPVVVMMAQCYGGSFGNIIYRGGDPNQVIAEQERCGFFGTIKTRTSVGCTPAVDEADYRDYSSSFFAGLSGKDRLGRSVTTADFNRDGRVSYMEAHAFAKVDNLTTDVPISSGEIWLLRQANALVRQQTRYRPLTFYIALARPHQKYALTGLVRLLQWDSNLSFRDNEQRKPPANAKQSAWALRLQNELIYVAVEQNILQNHQLQLRQTWERLLRCEERSP
jgi:hypothetical protein